MTPGKAGGARNRRITCPVFVLTHHTREPLVMQGGTTFHFVTDGIHAALDAAKKAAGIRDVRIGGGADTVRQYLQTGLVDEVHLPLSHTLLGQGEALLDHATLCIAAYGFLASERLKGGGSKKTPLDQKRLSYPKAIRRAAAGGMQRHVPDFIPTLRDPRARAIEQRLDRSPCCALPIAK